MDRRQFMKQGLAATAGAIALGAGWPLPAREYILGHGTHQYRLRADWSSGGTNRVPIKDAHEMVQSRDGRLFLLTNETRNNIIIFNTSGKVLDTWGTSFPGGHGLTLHAEGEEEFLYITDYERHQVIKTTLDGRVVLTIDAPLYSEHYTDPAQFKPTETAIGPDGSIYVADGYGAQWISVFDPKGQLINVFGGPDHFNNAHGIALDQRGAAPMLLITAREQNKLKQFSLKGEWLTDIDLPGAMINRPVIRDQNIYLSVLKTASRSSQPSGFVMVLDAANRPVSCPGGSDPQLAGKKELPWHQTINYFQYPHDVCVDANENLYIPQWNAGGIYPIQLERV